VTLRRLGVGPRERRDTLDGVHQALIKYTAMRMALFVAVLIVLGLLMGPSLGMLIASALISLALSYLLLRGPRDQLTQAITERTEQRLNDKAAAREAGLERSDADIEDDLADQAIRAEQEPRQP
jgi:hypothetical protein